MSTIKVDIYANAPLFITADADHFGKLFASMAADDQVHVLRAMVEHMKPHQIQWDYVSIELEKPENRDVLDVFRRLIPVEEAV